MDLRSFCASDNWFPFPFWTALEPCTLSYWLAFGTCNENSWRLRFKSPNGIRHSLKFWCHRLLTPITSPQELNGSRRNFRIAIPREQKFTTIRSLTQLGQKSFNYRMPRLVNWILNLSSEQGHKWTILAIPCPRAFTIHSTSMTAAVLDS